MKILQTRNTDKQHLSQNERIKANHSPVKIVGSEQIPVKVECPNCHVKHITHLRSDGTVKYSPMLSEVKKSLYKCHFCLTEFKWNGAI